MGNKSSLSIKDFYPSNSNKGNGSVFFGDNKKDDKFKHFFAFVWKWLKIVIFLFFMLMGLWGCFQQMNDSTIYHQTNIGYGLECGFLYGTTGDWRFDCQSYGGTYNTYNEWTFAYGPFYGIFIYPVARVFLNFLWATRDWPAGWNSLLGIFILVLIIRGLTLAMSLKATLQTEKMNEIQGKLAEINAKYKGLKDRESMAMRRQETTALYKKYDFKPLASFQQIFLTMPIYLIIFHVISIVRPLKSVVLFNIWNISSYPRTEIFQNFMNGGWIYIFFLLIILPVQFCTLLLPQLLAKKRNKKTTSVTSDGLKQQRKTFLMQVIMALTMCLFIFMSSCGVGIYWFFSGCFTIIQAWVIHILILKRRMKDRDGKANYDVDFD